MLAIFWGATAGLTLCALAFAAPPLWRLRAYWYSSIAIGFLCVFSYFMYSRLGESQQMPKYYSHESIQLRNSTKQLRPLYARLQRELVKDTLDLQFDVANLDLILHFAALHSQLQQGILEPEVERLLLSLLKAVPMQVKALNLLAIHSYKTNQFAQAISYWQLILQQFTPEMRNTPLEQVLLNKIAEANIHKNEFESRRTKLKNMQ
jgi:hypothetical protein